jgi:hypothetical protein
MATSSDGEDVKPRITQDANSEADDDSDVEVVASTDLARDKGWPRITHLVYPAHGAKISLNPQNVAIKSVVHQAIQNLFHSLFFKNAFPDAPAKIKFTRDALYKAASDLEYREIAKRVSSDVRYVNALSGLVDFLFTVTPSRIVLILLSSQNPGLAPLGERLKRLQMLVSRLIMICPPSIPSCSSLIPTHTSIRSSQIRYVFFLV